MSLLSRIRRTSLRTKFVLPIAATMVLSILVISGYLIRQQADGFRRELETNGATMSRILAMQAESGVLFESKFELDDLLLKFSVFEMIESAAVYDGEGQILSQLGAFRCDGAREVRVVVDAAELYGEGHTTRYIEDAGGVEYLEHSCPVITRIERLDRENLGITSGIGQGLAGTYEEEIIGSVRLVFNLKQVNKAINRSQTAAIVLSLLVAAVTIALMTFFIGLVAKPVKALVQVTDQVAQGDLSQRVHIRQKDEIGQLATTFNNMIESLQQSRREIEEYNRTLEEKIIQRTRELENAQNQLVQSEKMSAIGQLAAGVAHELNNPLGGILGYAQFALEKMRKNDPGQSTAKEIEKYVRYLTDIETQARRCKGIVQNLLRFSRSSRNTDFHDVDINDVIRDTTTFVEHQLHMSQITLKVDLAEDLPALQGNAGQLQQVFTNLIINAMHASAAETEIQVKSRYSPALGEFGGAVEVHVTDQGCGIEPENLKKIFEPFFTTKDVGKGTGLGLSVSYGIVREHGGEIKVTSEVGRGTTFTLILPLQKQRSDTDIPLQEIGPRPVQKPS